VRGHGRVSASGLVSSGSQAARPARDTGLSSVTVGRRDPVEAQCEESCEESCEEREERAEG